MALKKIKQVYCVYFHSEKEVQKDQVHFHCNKQGLVPHLGVREKSPLQLGNMVSPRKVLYCSVAENVEVKDAFRIVLKLLKNFKACQPEVIFEDKTKRLKKGRPRGSKNKKD